AVESAEAAAEAARQDLDAAREELVDARRAAELADEALADADDDLAAAERTAQLRIRATYMEGGHLGLTTMILGIEDFNMVMRVTKMVEAAMEEDHATVDALAVARSIRQERLAAAAAATTAAQAVESRVEEAIVLTEDARDQAEGAAREADRTAERLGREADRLAEASTEVSRPRLELEGRLAAAKAALEAGLAGGSDVELVTVWADRGDGVMIGGITVSTVIGQQVQELLAAAAADGIVLGGGGYRTPMTTVRLREANGCPDIYDSPASSCRIPTAIPGRSMHERGLAIDFSYNGQTLCFGSGPRGCRGNRAFDWLAANAAEFGLQGSSVEAWHWSLNGN
ncbi:D-alanyl-D-alanine carboxypeptidase family protein, partial [Salsipaludibacter albus]|uniref:D-alanyl-D-alanine carboxypeptidase family protein n=1 Tax=Salsipaludibacter albus TaxID=2849650 RepID=UPI001EE47E70